MKKIHLKKGLTFNKEAISKLNDDQISKIKGGNQDAITDRSSDGNNCSCCKNSC